MTTKIDQKIKNILKDLRVAHQRSEKFYAKEVSPKEPIKPIDIFEMALAFDNEERILIDLELAYSEKYPTRYTKEKIDFLESEKKRLTHRIRAWQNRQFLKQSVLGEIIKKKQTTNFEIKKALKEEFISCGYKPTRRAANDFAEKLEREFPKINKWVIGACGGRDIEDIIMDEFRIPGI